MKKHIRLIGIMSIVTVACGSRSISEGDACNMAMTEFNAIIAKYNKQRGHVLVKVSETQCSNFSSISDQGVANIDVSFSNEISYDEGHSWGAAPGGRKKQTSNFSFIRTDQGWKFDVCRGGWC